MVVPVILAQTSSQQLPELGKLAGVVGVAVLVGLVLIGFVYAAGVVFSKFGWKFLDRMWHPRAFLIIVAGAMVVGSASSAVAFGSQTFWKIAAKPEQAVEKPAYQVRNDCKPVGFDGYKDLQRSEYVLGKDAYAKANSEVGIDQNSDAATVDTGTTKEIKTEPFLDFKPEQNADDGSCTQTPDKCFSVKVTYKTVEYGVQGNPKEQKAVKWYAPDSYDRAACGDIDPQEF